MDPSRPLWLAPGAASGTARLPGQGEALPAVDQRLVAPETGFEIVDGQVLEASPSHEPHAVMNSRLAYVLGASVRPGFQCAVDLLTRANRFSDVSPDASVFEAERDPETGGRKVEELVFEVRDTQALADVTRKVRLLAERGVRRLFCVEVNEGRVQEWSRAEGAWQELGPESAMDDERCLVRPLPVRALLDAARADDAVAAALLARGNAVLVEALSRQEQKGFADGQRKGFGEGERKGFGEGERKGFGEGQREGLREAIAAACELLRLELSTEQRAEIETLDEQGLRERLAQLRTRRSWG